MYCAQINSLTCSILTQNYRNTGKQNNENGTIIFQVPVVLKFNYRRKQSVLSIHHAGCNRDVKMSMWLHACLKLNSGDTCSGVGAAGAVPQHRFPFPGRTGDGYGPVTQRSLRFPTGLTWNRNTCLRRWCFWRNPWSRTFNFKGSLNEVILGNLSPVESKNGLVLMKRKLIIPDCFCLCLLWLCQALWPWSHKHLSTCLILNARVYPLNPAIWRADGDKTRPGHTGGQSGGFKPARGAPHGGNRSPAGAALRPHRLSAGRAPGNAAASASRPILALHPAAPGRSESAAEPGTGTGSRGAPAAAGGTAAGAPLRAHRPATTFVPAVHRDRGGRGSGGHAAIHHRPPVTLGAAAAGRGGRRGRAPPQEGGSRRSEAAPCGRGGGGPRCYGSAASAEALSGRRRGAGRGRGRPAVGFRREGKGLKRGGRARGHGAVGVAAGGSPQAGVGMSGGEGRGPCSGRVGRLRRWSLCSLAGRNGGCWRHTGRVLWGGGGGGELLRLRASADAAGGWGEWGRCGDGAAAALALTCGEAARGPPLAVSPPARPAGAARRLRRAPQETGARGLTRPGGSGQAASAYAFPFRVFSAGSSRSPAPWCQLPSWA